MALTNMDIQIAEPLDIPALAQLYQTTVLESAPERYSLEQTQMWAAFASDRDAFKQFILAATTFIATDETGI